MSHPVRKQMSTAIALAVMALPSFAQTAASDAAKPATQGETAAPRTGLETVLVTGQRVNRVSSGATNLDLEAKDTPQSISFITQEQIAKFGVTDVNDALRLTTGVRVEQIQTNLTRFVARGFEIKNTQIDGVGMPNGWGAVTGAMDSFGYEKLEVIRGANGLLTGTGNASGTINYVRKRPTNTTTGSVGVSYGSWDTKRIEGDYSTPLTADGSWAGRVVAAREEGGSHLRDFEKDRNFVYGVVDGQIGDHGVLSIGFSRQQADTTGNMWGQLTFVDNTGKQLEWDRSASATQDWTYWNTKTQTGFVEYTHDLSSDWRAKASYNYRSSDNDSALFMAYSVTGLNPTTHTGLTGWAYKSNSSSSADLFDLSINGKFMALGRRHEATFGVNWSSSKSVENYNPTSFGGPAFGALPAFPYAGNAIPEPAWGASVFYTSLDQRIKRAYGVTRLSVATDLHAILGVNWTQYHREGIDAVAAPFSQTVTNTSPYVGVSYDFTPTVMGYANYSYIFQPQEQLNEFRQYSEASKGTNYEIGVKAEWLDKRLLTTAAIFDAKQQGLATYAGTKFLEGYAFGYYLPIDIRARGLELEAAGKVGKDTDLVLGYTHLDMSRMSGTIGLVGGKAYPWVPRHLLNLTLSTRVPSVPSLSLGVNARWQSGTFNEDTYSKFIVHQSKYGVVNAFASWEIQPGLTLRANINNIGDKKYISSLYAASYYAAPRSYNASLDWRF